MKSDYSPRGEDFFKVTCQRRFFEVRYYKGTTRISGVYFSTLKKAQKAVEKLGTNFDVLIEWNLPEKYKDIAALSLNFTDNKEAQTVLMNWITKSKKEDK